MRISASGFAVFKACKYFLRVLKADVNFFPLILFVSVLFFAFIYKTKIDNDNRNNNIVDHDNDNTIIIIIIIIKIF